MGSSGAGRNAGLARRGGDIFGRLDAERSIEQLLAAQLAALERAADIHGTLAARLHLEAVQSVGDGARRRSSKPSGAASWRSSGGTNASDQAPSLLTPLVQSAEPAELGLSSPSRRKSLDGGVLDEVDSRLIRQRLLRNKTMGLNEARFSSGELPSAVTPQRQSTVQNSCFEIVTLMVIVANAFWIGIETDYNKAEFLSDAPKIFQVVDNFFCVYFVVEIIVRWRAYRRKLHAFQNRGFVFDFTLVLLMVWETWVMVILHECFHFAPTPSASRDWPSSSVLRVFRLFRLTRVARISRIMRSWPELIITIKGLGTAIQSVMATLCLLFLVIYVYAVMLTELLANDDIGKFNTVPEAIHFLLIQVVCGFDASFVNQMLAAGWVYYLLWLLYLFLCSLTIMNLLTGVLVDVVSSVATEEKEKFAIMEFRESVKQMVPSGSCNQQEFKAFLGQPEMVKEMTNLGVDTTAFEDFTAFIYEFVTEDLSLEDIISLVFQFRGNKTTTVKDIVDLRKFVTMELANLEARLVSGASPDGWAASSPGHS